jgi:hypothetical protein
VLGISPDNAAVAPRAKRRQPLARRANHHAPRVLGSGTDFYYTENWRSVPAELRDRSDREALVAVVYASGVPVAIGAVGQAFAVPAIRQVAFELTIEVAGVVLSATQPMPDALIRPHAATPPVMDPRRYSMPLRNMPIPPKGVAVP